MYISGLLLQCLYYNVILRVIDISEVMNPVAKGFQTGAQKLLWNDLTKQTLDELSLITTLK